MPNMRRHFAARWVPAALLCIATSLCSAPLRVHAQAPEKGPDQLRTMSRDELGIIKVLTMQENAWNRGDLAGFAAGYKNSPDTLFIGRQVSRGFDALLNDYKRNYPNRDAMGQLAFADLQPQLLDDSFAVVVGKYHLERGKKFGGNADGIFSLVFQKTDAGWKIIVDHTT